MKSKNQQSFIRVFFVGILFIVFINACGGYHFASDYNNLPGEITSISIPFFQNETYEANIESYFTRSLITQFIKNKKFTLRSSGADATLQGIVKKFDTQTIAYSAQDKVLEYRAIITLDLTLKNNQTGEIIWKKPSLTSDETYKVSAEDSAFTQATKKVAFQKIANELAEQIYEELVLGF
jgi:hypothetical protein